jgi:putative colanic acid biosynthesis acetyltransferase WcaF
MTTTISQHEEAAMTLPLTQDGRDLPNPYPWQELLGRVLWTLVRALLFRPVPRFVKGWHRFLLRTFGAKVGKGAILYNTVKVAFPWMLTIEENAVLGEGVCVYSLGHVFIGKHTVISQRAHLCAGSHDYTDPTMPLLRKPIRIGQGCWVCTEAFIGPGVTVGDGTVVGARAVVTGDIPPHMVCGGNPCRIIKPRVMKGAVGA